ncbi:MBL fold metallo-hydrolase [Paractinoplanes abujensis]|uniref:Glyoxylase-like metal-dependent hydrolase (Beta-lactamase superfamily II) n=1 Tax=Paractinoplanes abujensis TaxID=882441 RepID=A0A7W7CPS6_9ACTN|nr:MBL fold metallo-hydrolase [Actinoplanes abujensis]MBB4692487.1 glyoxylase-like metal-dependent hydrolase (beta-lactamase superfamily II) [Actinoplanes abujensis]GID24037.1 MBL fold metallo-hydrolase [Actinoplanes abujensis]
MLTQVADAVWVHESAFLRSNTTVVQGPSGVLLIDPGLQEHEMTCLADDLAGRPVVAGFSTHPHWDHLLWHPRFGDAPRHGTARCAAAAREQLTPEAKAEIIEHLEPTGIAEHVPLDLFGLITALPGDATHIPWDGPRARIIPHEAHAPGHAALLLEDSGVLVAGDMLSDVLIPMVGLAETPDPVGGYLAALQLLESTAGDATAVIPGHGSAGGPGETRARINRDRAYVLALRDARTPDDPRIGPAAAPGWEWVADVHAGQAHRLTEASGRGPN